MITPLALYLDNILGGYFVHFCYFLVFKYDCSNLTSFSTPAFTACGQQTFKMQMKPVVSRTCSLH